MSIFVVISCESGPTLAMIPTYNQIAIFLSSTQRNVQASGVQRRQIHNQNGCASGGLSPKLRSNESEVARMSFIYNDRCWLEADYLNCCIGLETYKNKGMSSILILNLTACKISGR